MPGYFISSKDSLKIIYEKSFKYLFILGLPITIGTTLLADRLIHLFYGEQFNNSVIILQILAWDILLIFLYWSLTVTLVSINKQNKVIIIAFLTAIINITLNIALIPSFSYIGAAIATIISEIFLISSYLYFNSRYIYSIKIHKIIPKPIIACTLMGIFIYQFNNINLFVLIMLAIILYFTSLFLLKGFSNDDIQVLKKLLKR